MSQNRWLKFDNLLRKTINKGENMRENGMSKKGKYNHWTLANGQGDKKDE